MLLRSPILSSLVAGCLLCATAALAQEPPVAPPLPSDIGPGAMVGDDAALIDLNAAEPAAMDAAELPEAVLDAPNPGPPAPKWKVLPHFDVSVLWNDNVFIQPDNEVEDFIFTFSPGLALGYLDEESRLEKFLDREERASRALIYEGSYLLLDYTPSFVVFLENDDEHSFDQDARLEARWQLSKLSVAAMARFVSAHETNTELNARIEHTGLSAGLAARYQFGERMSAELGAYFSDDEYEQASGNTEYRGEGFVNYEVSPLLRFGVGVSFGIVEVEEASKQTFERVLARGTYSLSEKVEAVVQGGVEWRQSDGAGEDRTNPIWEVELIYTPAELTRVSVDVYRRVLSSISQPEDFVETTGVALRFARTLRTGLRLTAEGGYRLSEYTDSTGGPERSDDYFYARLALLYNFAAWGSAGVSYEYRNNDSSRQTSSFANNQLALEVSVTF